jgi:1-acyl-sn-glycerol-3-phosphate acyltransferase
MSSPPLSPHALLWIGSGATCWLLFALACRRLLRNPRATLDAGLFLLLASLYVRLVHRRRVLGREHVPARGPLLVVSNHTAGIDPILIQSCVHFEVRWMMALDMQVPLLEPFWRWTGVIGVKRDASGAPSDATGVREALAHLKHAGVLGIFPEGGIERPPGRLRPFLTGVGLIAGRAGVPVLPVIIRGTPHTKTAWGSFLRPSRSVVEFLPVVRFPARSDPARVTRDLESMMSSALARAAITPPSTP